MRNFDILLWDLDGTLMNFTAAERAAIRRLFGEFGLGECTDDMLLHYAAINKKYWEMLERGEMTKPMILEGRFAEFFQSEGIHPGKRDTEATGSRPEKSSARGSKESGCGSETPAQLAAAFNAAYQVRLGDTVVFNDDSKELVERLNGKIPQYIVSNGTIVAQTKKLRVSGFDKLMDGVFLSEELGYEKPAEEFFEAVFKAVGVPPVSKERVLIVGDSLTSDIPGGNRAGIKTCWYNPDGAENLTSAVPDFEIRHLQELPDLL